MATLKQVEATGGEAIRETARVLGLNEVQVWTAARYYSEHEEEINARIERNARSAY